MIVHRLDINLERAGGDAVIGLDLDAPVAFACAQDALVHDPARPPQPRAGGLKSGAKLRQLAQVTQSALVNLTSKAANCTG